MGKTKQRGGFCSTKFADSFAVYNKKNVSMEPFRLFFDFLNKFIPLPEEDFNQIIAPRIEIRQFKKREIITQAGDIEKYLNFINHGLMRKYFLKDDEEIITQISLEGQIIHSQESFHSGTPSEYIVDAIEPTTVLSISRANMDAIFATNASMERMGRLIMTFIMVMSDRWQVRLYKHSPRERFLEFVQHNSQLMQRTPQKYLASLLNIQPETFSRFKHLVRTGSASSNLSQ